MTRLRQGSGAASPLTPALSHQPSPEGYGPASEGRGGKRAGSNSFHARLWKALRIMKKGTLLDFIALAEPGAMKNAHNSADHYFRALHLAGYVSVLARRRPGASPMSPGRKVFLLVRDSGPRSPRYNKARRMVSDINTGETFDISGGGAHESR